MTCALFAGALVFGGGSAFATTGYFTGLYAVDDGTVVAELDYTTRSYNKNMRITTDPYGDRQSIATRWRDKVPQNDRPTYVRMTWFRNGQYCLSHANVSLSAGTSGVNVEISSNAGCSTGWYDVGTTSSMLMHTDWWQYTTHKLGFTGDSDTSRAVVKVCQDSAAWLTDVCSGSRVLGSDT